MLPPAGGAETPALLVAFICNHCPYVIHIREGFATFAGEPVTGQQQPSLGCNIKWRPGNEPGY